jgi:hypothetical protein
MTLAVILALHLRWAILPEPQRVPRPAVRELKFTDEERRRRSPRWAHS